MAGKSDLERLHWERDVSSLRTSSWVWGLFHGVSLLVVWSCIYSCSSSLIAAGKAFIYLAALSPFAGIVCGIVISCGVCDGIFGGLHVVLRAED